MTSNSTSRILLTACVGMLLASCTNGPVTPTQTGDDVRSGGEATVFDATSKAFSLPAANLTAASLQEHTEGDRDFDAKFVSGQASVNGGLGPVFNNVSCESCHPSDGRGAPPVPGEAFGSMLFRISVPGTGPNGGPKPVPGFGGQFQDHAVAGASPEGTISTTYTDISGTFADGTEYHLRKPQYTVTSSYMPVPAGMLMSPRVGPPVFGLGLLEAVPENTILSYADESDANGDGISGKPNRVWDPVQGVTALGRFGWKAGAPTLYAQTAGAYNEDMGVTSSLLKQESCHGQSQYQGDQADADITDQTMDNTAAYVRTLGVPARRNASDPQVIAGGKIFLAANCSGCHIPTIQTGTALVAEFSNQTIHPYTDLLLHDMGDELSDNRPDFLATGNEWRTAPLWGIGLTGLVNGHTYFLHDGRARNLMEAIMWHGGEGAASRDYVRKLGSSDRNALLAFLGSL